MTRSLGAIAVAATLLAGSIPVASSSSPQGEAVTFRAVLSPANQVPPVTNDEPSATGEVTVVLNLTRDANRRITAATADFTGSVKGLPAGSTLTAAHIHRGASGSNGPVAVNPGFAAGDLALKEGAGSFSKRGVTVSPEAAQEIVSNPGTFYFNVHSQMNPAGVARGQLAVPAAQ